MNYFALSKQFTYGLLYNFQEIAFKGRIPCSCDDIISILFHRQGPTMSSTHHAQCLTVTKLKLLSLETDKNRKTLGLPINHQFLFWAIENIKDSKYSKFWRFWQWAWHVCDTKPELHWWKRLIFFYICIKLVLLNIYSIPL